MPALTLPRLLFLASFLRIALFLHGLYQDANSTLKYTDIDYYVFTDASRALSEARSPYSRETYRYTPLLAYILYPTTYWFNFGKLVFAVSDVVAGWAVYTILLRQGAREQQALWYSACTWLLNPMVATISTRGSSEGLLGVMVIGLLWAATSNRTALAGVLLGLATHFKIYPVIYAPAILLSMEHDAAFTLSTSLTWIRDFVTRKRVIFGLSALSTFVALNAGMYALYGHEFLQHTYLHHFVRVDHRHNFSPYNVLLYLDSVVPGAGFSLAKWAFLPQMLLSAVVLPLVLAKRDLAGTMFAQTFTFVAFNKVCTSQVCYPGAELWFFPHLVAVSRAFTRWFVGVPATSRFAARK